MVFAGLESSKAFDGVFPAPRTRSVHVSRPDLDSQATRRVHERYLHALEDERAGAKLLMHARQNQRQLHASQREDVRSLETRLRTPFRVAEGRRARERAAQQEASWLEQPLFSDAITISQQIANAMARARGVRGNKSNVVSTCVRERQLRDLPVGSSVLLHAPAHAPVPPQNALAVARVNQRTAALRTARTAVPLSVGQLHMLVGHLLEEKIQADAVDDAQGHARQPLLEFVSDELWRRYGLRELAEAHGRSLFDSVLLHAHASERVRTFAAAVGWAWAGDGGPAPAGSGEGAEPWPLAKVALWLRLLTLLLPADGLAPGVAVREKLSPAGPVWLSLPAVREALRRLLYSRPLEERLIAELEALAEPDPSGALLSGRRLSLDKAVTLVLSQFELSWDSVVSHLHRPTYAEGQLFLSREAGHYTQTVREEEGHHDVLPSAYTNDFYRSSSDQLLAQQLRPGSRRPSVFTAEPLAVGSATTAGGGVGSQRSSRRPSVFM